jgi:hypothetical protein
MWRISGGRVSRREEVGIEDAVVWDRSDMDLVLHEEREAGRRGVISCLAILKEVTVSQWCLKRSRTPKFCVW